MTEKGGTGLKLRGSLAPGASASGTLSTGEKAPNVSYFASNRFAALANSSTRSLTRYEAETSNTTLFLGFLLFGIGFGFVNSPITNTAVSGMPASQAGVAAAVASTSRQVGLTLGVALAGAIAGGSTLLEGGAAAGFTAAARPAWWMILGAVAAVLVLAVVSTTRWAEATARRAAEAYA